MPCNFERGVRPSIACVETAAHCQTTVRRPAETVVRVVECDRATSSYARFIGPGVFLDADLDRKRTIPTLVVAGGESLCLAERRTANSAYNMSHAGAMRLLGIADQRRDSLRCCVRGQSQGTGRTRRGASSPPANGSAQRRATSVRPSCVAPPHHAARMLEGASQRPRPVASPRENGTVSLREEGRR